MTGIHPVNENGKPLTPLVLPPDVTDIVQFADPDTGAVHTFRRADVEFTPQA